MEHTYFVIALVSAGIAIPVCILCIVLGIIDKNHKDYLVFGMMSFFLAGHLLSPPLGFVIHASAPYTLDIEFKRVFIFSYYMLIPLFVAYYTDYYIKLIYYVIGGLVVVCYIGMTMSTGENSFPLWAHMANVIFLLNRNQAAGLKKSYIQISIFQHPFSCRLPQIS